MAKVKAPFLSFSGSGQIAKAFVASTWRGVKYVREYVVPANPQTAAQSATRNVFSMLSGMWKVADALAVAPWDAFATGKKFLGRNAFIGQNVEQMRGESDMDLFIGSPGNAGGLPPTSFSGAAGGSSGEIDVTFVNPSAPTGWVLESEIFFAFPDQDPALPFAGPLVADENDPPTGSGTLAGLGSGVACEVVGFLKWTKPDGTIAYSVGTTDQVTSAV